MACSESRESSPALTVIGKDWVELHVDQASCS